MHVNYPRLWQLRELDNAYLSTSSPVHAGTISAGKIPDRMTHLVTWLVEMAFTRLLLKTNKSPAAGAAAADGDSSFYLGNLEDPAAFSHSF